jgi:hypothetical protein
MALVTIGTNATITWSGVQWLSSLAPADIASINNVIKGQGTLNLVQAASGFANNGILTYPDGRGQVKLVPGDWIMITSTGFPVVVSNRAVVADMTHG